MVEEDMLGDIDWREADRYLEGGEGVGSRSGWGRSVLVVDPWGPSVRGEEGPLRWRTPGEIQGLRGGGGGESGRSCFVRSVVHGVQIRARQLSSGGLIWPPG